MQYSHTAVNPVSWLPRHNGWIVVMENCKGVGGRGPGFSCGTVPQYTSTSNASPPYLVCSPKVKVNEPSLLVWVSAISEETLALTSSSVRIAKVSLGLATASEVTSCASRLR